MQLQIGFLLHKVLLFLPKKWRTGQTFA